MLKRTPLFDEHLRLGAKMAPFAGFEMPISYQGIIAEHEAVRQNCGLFDIGHMGVIDIAGKEAVNFINYVATNDASLLKPSECQYAILCNENGGAIDDILVYKIEDNYRIIANASNTEKVLKHLHEESKKFEGVSVVHRIDLSMIALQGPKAVSKLCLPVTPTHNFTADWDGMVISRTGYTGEDGYEIFAPIDMALRVWNDLKNNGAVPCGLGARDTLRLEAGLPLYGHEYNEEISPLEVGYSWAVKFEKKDFIGKAALQKQKTEGAKLKLVGLKFNDKAIPRQGYKVFSDNKEIGKITSGTFSPTLKLPIALAFIDTSLAIKGNMVQVEIRDKPYPAVVGSKKFI